MDAGRYCRCHYLVANEAELMRKAGGQPWTHDRRISWDVRCAARIMMHPLWRVGMSFRDMKNAKQKDRRSRVGRIRADSLRQRYGIDDEKYQQMLIAQNGCCALCGGTDKDRWGRFHVDHDHTTMRLRGLLCPKCNLGLGTYESLRAKIPVLEAYIASGV